MKLSLNWIKQYTDVELPVAELVKKIGSQLGEVEAVTDLAPKYQGALIVKVVSCDDHPNADRLHVCMVDDGGQASDVVRDENGLVRVVCGAPNVKAGMFAVWLPPGVTVPSTFDTDPFVLEARELRGIVSNGMLASPQELALGDNHDGILEINAEEWSPRQADIRPGADFAAVFGLDDTIVEIENKMFTHRPDLFGQLGLAREVAGITGRQFTSPAWYLNESSVPDGSGLELTVTNAAPELVPRLMAVTIKDAVVKQSPLWLQAELVRIGAKPINNIVDVTNYIMHLTAQPTHAYDYDKLLCAQLTARMAADGETAELLNHKTYHLTGSDIVIADAEEVVGLGGVMGGETSEVSDTTTNIVLECASFDMYAVRRTSMRHGLFTDALTRFSKGQSVLQNPHVMQLLITSIQDVAGGTVASPLYDAGNDITEPAPVQVSVDFINARLGLKLGAEQMATLLTNVEFVVTIDRQQLTVVPPFWRTDIEIPEDVIEEVGRLTGYDQLPLALPVRDARPTPLNDAFVTASRIRSSLVAAGANELLTYSFVPQRLIAGAQQDTGRAFQIANALSPELQYYRLTGLASLLDKVHLNSKAGYDRFVLFELSKIHDKTWPLDEQSVPLEAPQLNLVYAAKTAQAGAAFYQVRRYVDELMDNLGLQPTFRQIESVDHEPLTDPYDLQRSAVIWVDGRQVGVIGEFKLATRRAFKLPTYAAGCTMDISALGSSATTQAYQPLPRFPKTQQDICLRVATTLPFGELAEFLQAQLQALKPADCRLELVPRDIFQRDDDREHKQVTFRVTLTSYERTLTDQEVAGLLDEVSTQAGQRFNAERV